MGRNRDTQGYNAFLGKAKINLPFLEEFLNLIKASESTKVSTKTLHQRYMEYVDKRTDLPGCKEECEGFRRFATQFRNSVKGRTFRTFSKPERGYYCEVKGRIPRSTAKPDQEADEALERLFHSKCKGYGAFSKRVLEKGTPVGQYVGQVVAASVFADREKDYSLENKIVTMIDIGHGRILDGNCRPSGETIPLEENRGAWLNHEGVNPSCAPRMIKKGEHKEIWVFTKYVIPRGWELTWNYGDTDSDAPDWLNMT
jgi:hypothetical protein